VDTTRDPLKELSKVALYRAAVVTTVRCAVAPQDQVPCEAFCLQVPCLDLVQYLCLERT
jgi:hypothetical protein